MRLCQLLRLGGVLWLIAIAGCTKTVEISVTRFHEMPPGNSTAAKRFMVMPLNSAQESSLEWKQYARVVGDAFSKLGYVKVQETKDSPDFVITFAYAIGNGTVVSTAMPLYGQTGGGQSTFSGTVTGPGGSSYVNGSTYSQPTYGVVGTIPISYTIYNRVLVLQILDGPQLVGGQAKTLFEATAKSTGTTSVLSSVMPYLIAAVFDGFPGKNGSTVEVRKEMATEPTEDEVGPPKPNTEQH